MTPASDDLRVKTASLHWKGGIPVSTRFEDPYYSTENPVGEVRHTFLDGVGFEGLCRSTNRPVIAETGFGTGLNFLEAWSGFEALAPQNARLTFLSVEAYPLSKTDLVQAHGHFPHLRQKACELHRKWPGAVPGDHRIDFANGRIRLILLIGEAGDALARHDFKADAWFLDGFAPSRNPRMWRKEVLQNVARLSKTGGRLASFTAAGAVRRGLEEAGFHVEKRPGFGRKRDCISATRHAGPSSPNPPFPWTAPPPPLPESASISVIGHGIAGQAMAAALRAEGRPVDIIAGKESTAYAASTLPSALIAPKLVRGNQPYARFWRQAFFDSLRVLEDLDLWDGPRGLLIPAQDPLQQQQQEALLSDLAWPEEHLRYVSSRETLQLLGRPSSGGLYLKEAGSIVPDRLRDRLAPEVDFSADVVALEQRGSYWHLKGKGSRLITKAEAVVVAAGPGSSVLLGEAVSLRIAAGRMVQFPSEAASRCSLLSNGYVTSKNPKGLISAGATAEPRASIAPVLEDPEKDAHLFDRIGKNIPDVWKTKGQIWRGLRCDTADHLPLIGPVPDSAAFKRDYDGLIHGKKPSQMAPPVFMPGLYALTGLGARGFQAAFLGADLICAQMHGMPAPLDQRLCAALSVSRSLIKQLKSAGSS